jgi:hypothetical protein
MGRNVAILFLSTNRIERGNGLKGGCFILIPNGNEGRGEWFKRWLFYFNPK